ncbi:Na+/H+ antiporter NhaA [Neptunomonas japonica]|uniref:Na(+)/H(+) antiporter NhaA n=1 Tax=Neptunomonas japonica JAMM 1380 TaxID=1441457 RepID=A0A7R6PI97_9GAMM|nr:Na+/H+ antiporter NhaA [Neptunomonas japonica]BBB29631.1 Na+:H+ antiporter, NhaA family [Neptunomonas japonica JAMM 1380]
MPNYPDLWTHGSSLSSFFKLESAGGITLMLAAVLAMILANSPYQHYYDLLISTPVEIRVGALHIAKPLLLWINDGLMAIFFFLVGLELKRELIEGELADKCNIILPGVGAIGGMAAPALIYTFFNIGDTTAMKGWAIPAATDIAFALGILMLLGARVPISIKMFLTSLAIFDDMGAILIIAVFYTENISVTALLIVTACLPLLVFFNKKGVESKTAFILVGIIMWIAMLKSGIHATLAGVIVAMFVPMKSRPDSDYSPLKSMEHDLHFAVAFFILPIFAFANAGISFTGMGSAQIMHSVPLGIALGLFLGKQVGVFGLCWLAIKLNWSRLPKGMSWGGLYGTAVLCGVGFTMSLFIGSLAFDETVMNQLFDQRIGIILGSLISGIVGFVVLNRCLPAKRCT